MVAALRASGERPAALARRHGLHEVRVQRWVVRVSRKARSATPGQPVAFAPVRVTSAQPAVSGLEVAVGGAVVRVGRSTTTCCGAWWRRSRRRHVEPATDGPSCTRRCYPGCTGASRSASRRTNSRFSCPSSPPTRRPRPPTSHRPSRRLRPSHRLGRSRVTVARRHPKALGLHRIIGADACTCRRRRSRRSSAAIAQERVLRPVGFLVARRLHRKPSCGAPDLYIMRAHCVMNNFR
jgi:transposase-like protein